MILSLLWLRALNAPSMNFLAESTSRSGPAQEVNTTCTDLHVSTSDSTEHSVI